MVGISTYESGWYYPCDMMKSSQNSHSMWDNPSKLEVIAHITFCVNKLIKIGPQGKKMGPIGWPQIGFKFGFNPIMYLITPNKPNLNLILGQVVPPVSKFGFSWFALGPQARVQIRADSGQVGRVHLAELIPTYSSSSLLRCG